MFGTPARDDAVDFGAPPCERAEHATVRARERRDGARNVGALDPEAVTRIVPRFHGRLERESDRIEPARAVDAHRVGDATVLSAAELEKRTIDFVELKRHARCRRPTRFFPARKEFPCLRQESAATIPLGAALRKAFQQRLRRWQLRTFGVAASDGVLERLQRGDVANAHVAIAVARRLQRIRLARLRDDKENAEQHGNERDARGHGQLQERHPARLSHGCPRP